MWTALACDLHSSVTKQGVRFRSKILFDDKPGLGSVCMISEIWPQAGDLIPPQQVCERAFVCACVSVCFSLFEFVCVLVCVCA